MTHEKLNFSLIKHNELKLFLVSVFKKIGCSTNHSTLAADVLLTADLRGIDSHGAARLKGYIALWEKGRINTKPKFKIIREKNTTTTLDADSALGLVSAPKAMEISIEKAEKYGSGWVSVCNSNHFGIAAYHAMKAIEKNMIGYSVTNASPLVAPAFSRERMLGTNPICYAIPAGKYPPIVIDMATSAAANGKLEIAQRKKLQITQGWVQTADGNTSTDPDELKNGGSLLPLGSNENLGFHKGYALGSMVDIFSGVLSGANFGPWVPPFVSFIDVLPNLPGKGIGHFVGAWQIDGFREIEEYNINIEKWIERFKKSEPIDKNVKVLIPGEPEHYCYKDRIENGIPIIENVITDLKQIAEKFKLHHPF
ncbi:MAG: Ldh family oxidoreductase [Bacteroidetes bacterium]|nr:Ldh family oxidoreductase [Bacteroidota bacterium]